MDTWRAFAEQHRPTLYLAVDPAGQSPRLAEFGTTTINGEILPNVFVAYGSGRTSAGSIGPRPLRASACEPPIVAVIQAERASGRFAGSVGRLARFADRVADAMPPETIRPARLADAERVWPLVREFATSFAPERDAFDATWPQQVDASGVLVLVAESGEGIVGYLLANAHLTFLANGPVAWVEEVMVVESCRRAGVGGRLMGHAEEWARTLGAGYLALASRRSGAFYDALGYEDSAVFYKKTLR